MNGRSFDFELTEMDKKIFAPLTDLLNNNENKYFVGFRTQPNRMSIYYMGLEMCNFEYKNNKWFANARKLSSTESNTKILKINDKFVENLLQNNFNDGLMIELNEKFDVKKFIEINKEFVGSYIKIKGIREKGIQHEIACSYMKERNGLICLDQEYILSDKIRNSKRIAGRYDFIFLKKENNGTYKIVPAELKSMKKACVDTKTGIMNHFEDMKIFQEEFNSNEEFRINILNDVLFSLNMKKAFGLLDESFENIENTISEWWLLFKMVGKEFKYEPHVKPEYHKLIEEELTKKNEGIRSNLGYKLEDVLEEIETQKSYYLTDDYEFEEI